MFPRAGEARVQEPCILFLHLFKVKSVRIPEFTVMLFVFHDAHVAISLPFSREFLNGFPWPSCPLVPFLNGIWLPVLCSYLQNIPLIVLCSQQVPRDCGLWLFSSTNFSFCLWTKEKKASHLQAEKTQNVSYIATKSSSLLRCCSSFLSLAVINTILKTILVKKEFISALAYSPPFKETRGGAEAETWRRELKQRSQRTLLTSLTPLVSSVTFQMQPRTACLVMVLHTAAWSILYQLAIKKIPDSCPQVNLIQAVFS